MTTKLKLNETVKESIEVYGDGLRELLHEMGLPPEEWDTIWSSDDEEHEEDAELQWFIGWFAGVAETIGVPCSELIALDEEETPVKKAAAKKKTPVKKAAAKKKTPVKTPVKKTGWMKVRKAA